MTAANELSRLAKVWSDPTTHALVLLLSYLDMFVAGETSSGLGEAHEEPLSWSPETIDMELTVDLGVDVPGCNLDKLMTAIMVHTTNSFLVSVPDFIRTCVTLSGTFHQGDTLVMPDCEAIAWGVTEALLINPPEEKDENPFCPEIVGFIGEALKEEGIITPPDVLRIGTHDGNMMANVSHEFSDDPEMFAMIQSTEAGRTEDINQSIRERMRTMLGQLKELPMRHGKTGIADKMLSKL